MKKNTRNGFAYANQLNLFGDFPTAHIDACYRDGRFYDIETKNEVVLEENALVRLVVEKKDIPKQNQSRFYTKLAKVQNRGSVLLFRLADVGLLFHVELMEALIFEKNGNKLAKAQDVHC